MARRGTSNFRLNDARRAVRVARREGIEPTMLEIIGRDGTVFRVHGRAASTPSAAEKQWNDALRKSQKVK